MTNDQNTSQQVVYDGGRERLIAELTAEVESLVAAGKVNATEQVLQQHSDLQIDDELIVSLLYEEIVSAEGQMRSVAEQDLLKRFPNLSERISRLVAFHETLKPAINFDGPIANDPQLRSHDTDSPASAMDTKVDHPISTSIPRPIDIDQFEILEKIGEGGMGIVYRARQKNLNRVVALKRLRYPFVDSDDRQRLMNEARAVAKLHHPGIVQIHHIGESNEQPYLCFEYIAGGHLAERLANSTLSPVAACRLLQKITNAISFAHDHGIIHRDLKPANILIDVDGEPKVADFGLAKFQVLDKDYESSPKLTQTGAVLGTICYMSPEQFVGKGNNVDHRIDIYGLGTILYEMLVGRPPLLGDTPDETMYQVRMVEPTPPRKLNPKIPRDVETICLKCLEKDPANRFESCAQLERELQHFINGEPLSIRPTSSFTVATRWCKRRPAVAILSAISGLLIVALSVGGYWIAWSQAQHAIVLQQERDLSRDSAALASRKANEAEQATRFMINTLGSAHPDRDGRNVTVAERLADGLREIHDTKPVNLNSRAALLSAIGKTYIGLGLFQDANEPLKQAWECYSEIDGRESLEALNAEVSYGDLLRSIGRYEQAEQHLLHALDGLSERLGSDARETIAATIYLAQTHYQQGRRDEAIDLLSDSYDRYRQSGVIDENSVQTLLTYTDALIQAGRLTETRRLIEEVLPDATETLGSDSLRVIDLRGSLARVARAEGDFRLALEEFKEIHEQLSRKLGETHFKTLISLNDIAIVYGELGEPTNAAEILTDVKEEMARTMGESHPQTLRAILNVARTMESTGRRNDARKLLQQTFELSSEAVGYLHPETMMMATQYARSLAENNEFEQAEALLDDAVEFFRDFKSVDPVTRGEPFMQLAVVYKRTDRGTEAIELYQQALDIAQTSLGTLNPSTLSAKNNLASAYFQLGQDDQAAQLYEETLRDLRKTLGHDDWRTLFTALNLAIVYRAEQRFEAAIEILSEIVPIMERVADHPWVTYSTRFQLGRAFLDSNQIDEANRELEIAFAGFVKLAEQQPASATIGVANQLRTVIRQFEEFGETQTADMWRNRRQFMLKK